MHIKGENLLSISEWKGIIDQLEILNVKKVIVIGGEPCLHRNINELLEYLATKNMAITLFTNGYFLEGELLETVIKNKIDVKVSLYGHNSVIHDGITGIKGSFDKLIQNIVLLRDNGVNVYIATTLMKENEEYYEDINAFIKKLNVSGAKFDVIREVVNGSQCEHLPDQKSIIQKAYRKRANFFIRKYEFDEYILHNTCWYSKLVVCENGDILPCVFERNRKCGNVREKTLKNILESSELKRCWDFDFSQIDECRVCEYRYACKDCRPMAESVGNILGKNPRCLYKPYKGEWESEACTSKL